MAEAESIYRDQQLANDGSASGGILGPWATIGSDYATLNGSNKVVAYTGYTAISGGGLISSGTGQNGKISTSGGAINMAAAGTTNMNTLLFAGTTANQTVTVGLGNTLVLGAKTGNGGVFNTSSSGGTQRTLTISAGTLTVGDGMNPGSLTFISTSTSTTSAFTITSSITDNSLLNPSNPAPVSVTLAGGYVNPNSTNTFSGGLYILSGRWSQASEANSGTGPIYIMPGGQANTSDTWDNTHNFFIAGNGTAENNGMGALRLFGSGSIAGTITLTGSASICVTNGGTDTISGQITGPGGLEIGHGNGTAGGGVLSIGPTNGTATANNYAGNTTITGPTGGSAPSTLMISTNTDAVSNNNNLMPHGISAGNLMMDASTVNASTFDLNGTTQTINGLSSTVTAPTNNFITSSTTGGVLILGDNNAGGSYAGLIQDGLGSLAIQKTGTGAEVFSGSNSYSGGTTVSGGTLQMGIQ